MLLGTKHAVVLLWAGRVIFVHLAAEWMNETFDGRCVSQAGRAAGSTFYGES